MYLYDIRIELISYRFSFRLNALGNFLLVENAACQRAQVQINEYLKEIEGFPENSLHLFYFFCFCIYFVNFCLYFLCISFKSIAACKHLARYVHATSPVRAEIAHGEFT